MRKSPCNTAFSRSEIAARLGPNARPFDWTAEGSVNEVYDQIHYAVVMLRRHWEQLPEQPHRRSWSGQDMVLAWTDNSHYIGRARRAFLKANGGLTPIDGEGGEALPNDGAYWNFIDMAEIPDKAVESLGQWLDGKVHKFAQTCCSIWGMPYSQPGDDMRMTSSGDIVYSAGGATATYPWDEVRKPSTPWNEARMAEKRHSRPL